MILSSDLIVKYPKCNSYIKSLIDNRESIKWIGDYANWMDNSIDLLHSRNRRGIIIRLMSESIDVCHEAIAELVYGNLWYKLKWDFEKDPNIRQKNPDFYVRYGNKEEDSFFGYVPDPPIAVCSCQSQCSDRVLRPAGTSKSSACPSRVNGNPERV